MSVRLDEDLIRQAQSPGGFNSILTLEEKIAINVLWRKGVTIPVLVKVFRVAKNTLYYNCLTGDSGGYPQTPANQAREVNQIVDKLGLKAAEDMYVTDEMKRAVNYHNRERVERRSAA